MQNCGNCSYCAESGKDLICINPKSEYVSDYVEESHSCEEWEGGNEECE